MTTHTNFAGRAGNIFARILADAIDTDLSIGTNHIFAIGVRGQPDLQYLAVGKDEWGICPLVALGNKQNLSAIGHPDNKEAVIIDQGRRTVNYGGSCDRFTRIDIHDRTIHGEFGIREAVTRMAELSGRTYQVTAGIYDTFAILADESRVTTACSTGTRRQVNIERIIILGDGFGLVVVVAIFCEDHDFIEDYLEAIIAIFVSHALGKTRVHADTTDGFESGLVAHGT